MNNKRYCSAFGCLNSSKRNADVSFFTLPKNAERRREWLQRVGREDLLQKENLNNKSYVVCSAHFEHSAIKVVKLLKTDTLPTKLLPDQSGVKQENTHVPLPHYDVSQTKPYVHTTSNVIIMKHNTTSVAIQTETVTLSQATQTLKTMTKNTPRKRKLLKQLNNSEHKRRRLKGDFIKIQKELEANNLSVVSTNPEHDVGRRESGRKGRRIEDSPRQTYHD